MRRLYLLLTALGVIVFLGISVLLARAFNADGAERDAITALVRAEAAGTPVAVIAGIHGCAADAACRARAGTLAGSLRRTGKVVILALDTSTSFSLTSSTGTARVAWDTSAEKLPVVQCVRVHRAGNVVSGIDVQLLRLSVRIKSDADCPSRF